VHAISNRQKTLGQSLQPELQTLPPESQRMSAKAVKGTSANELEYTFPEELDSNSSCPSVVHLQTDNPPPGNNLPLSHQQMRD
jgi:hypothetical protein